MANSKYREGQKYGLLTLLSIAPTHDKRSRWNVRCDCGFIFTCRSDNFARPNPKCNNCKYKLRPMPQRTHGQSKTPLYKVWAQMIQRCHNPKNSAYHKYGKRGITVCEEWRTFENFYADMGEPPKDGIKYSLEREINSGNYEPGNVIWDTPKRQSRNTRTNHLVTIKDQTKTIAEWAEISGVKYDTIFARLEANWPTEYLLVPPIYKGRRPFPPTQP